MFPLTTFQDENRLPILTLVEKAEELRISPSTIRNYLGVSMGSWREYRQGKWKLKFWDKGELVELYSNKDGDPLESNGMCARAMAYIEELIKDKKFRRETWRKTGPHLFEQACETWIQSKKKLAYGTVEARKRIVYQYLIPRFEKMDIKDITRSDLEEFKSTLEAKNLSGKTIYNIMADLRAMLRFHLDVVPRFPVCEFQRKAKRWLTEEQQNWVFEFIPPEDKPIFIFQRYSGCRPNEARGLLRKNVLRDKGIILIASVLNEHNELVERTKTKRVRPVAIIPEFEGFIKPKSLSPFLFTKFGEPYKKRTHEKIWHTAVMKAHEVYEVPIISLYPGTKHSLGMNRLKQGFHRDELQALFGHQDKKSVDDYAEYLAETLASVMRGKVIEIKKEAERK